MQIEKRKIKVTISKDSLADVLGNLCPGNDSDSIVIKLELPDNKNTYKYLSSTPGITDWDFADSTTSSRGYEGQSSDNGNCAEQLPRERACNYSEKPEELKDDESDNSFNFPSYEVAGTNIENFIRVIESTWNIAKDNPGVRFGTKLFNTIFVRNWNDLIKEKIQPTDLTRSTTREVAKLVYKVYYNFDTMTDDGYKTAYDDTVCKLKEHYSELKTAKTLSEVMNLLYRSKN